MAPAARQGRPQSRPRAPREIRGGPGIAVNAGAQRSGTSGHARPAADQTMPILWCALPKRGLGGWWAVSTLRHPRFGGQGKDVPAVPPHCYRRVSALFLEGHLHRLLA
jgi:hypothetical protein